MSADKFFHRKPHSHADMSAGMLSGRHVDKKDQGYCVDRESDMHADRRFDKYVDISGNISECQPDRSVDR